MKVISGRSNPELAKKICIDLSNFFNQEINLTECILEPFGNGEIRVVISENIRGNDIYIVQTGVSLINDKNNKKNKNTLSINDIIMETLLIIDAAVRAGCKKVIVIFAHFPYARSDKKDRPRVPIGSSLVLQIIQAAGADRIISMDLHSGQIQGNTQLPFDNLYATPLFLPKLELLKEIYKDKLVVVSLDVGGAKRVEDYAKRLSLPHAIMSKQRDYSQVSTVDHSYLLGNVEGKICICIDDIVDTGGTLIKALSDLKNHGATGAIVVATHGLFSAQAIKRINDENFIHEIWVTDTISQNNNMKNCDKLVEVGSSYLFAKVIQILHTKKGSISKILSQS